MLTARTVIFVVVLVAILSLVASTLSLIGPRDRDGMGADSYGTQRTGYRAIFEILAELGVTVDRTIVPANEAPDVDATVVIWGPNSDFVCSEPVYLQRLGDWVRRGGRVVIAPEDRKIKRKEIKYRPSSPIEETTALAELGLSSIGTSQVDLATFDHAGKQREAHPEKPAIEDTTRSPVARGILEVLSEDLRPTRSVSVNAEGDLAQYASSVRSLDVPEKLQTLVVNDSEPSGLIIVKTKVSDPLTIAASYRLGKGEIIVVSDREVFENRVIAKEDNAVLAVQVLVDGRRTVLWDEFYHGLTIRGQPLFLLTRRAYLMFALIAIAATAMWVWRSAVFLGPPLSPVEATRRSLAEYVSAMGQFISRAPRSRRFLIEQIRAGVMWSLSKRLSLPAAEQSPSVLAAAIARHNPAGARQLLDSLAAVDLTLSKRRVIDRHIVQTLKDLNDCL